MRKLNFKIPKQGYVVATNRNGGKLRLNASRAGKKHVDATNRHSTAYMQLPIDAANINLIFCELFSRIEVEN